MNVLLIGGLIISKLFYISLFEIAGFNFTLSDLCLALCLAHMIIRFFVAKDLRDLYESDIYDHLRRMLIFAVGAFLLNVATTMAAGSSPIYSILDMVKRWQSMVIIPFYFCTCVKQNKRLLWVCIIVMIIYAIMNSRSIISLNAERFGYEEGGFNPNILGALFGLIMVYTINSKYSNSIKISVSMISVFMIFACSTRGAVLAVGATFVILRFLTSDKSDALAKIGKALMYVLLAVVGLYLLSKLIPAATERLVESFSGGITKTNSFVSRTKTAKLTIAALIYNPRLLLFGTGFGTYNQSYVLARYGYQITTSDNMYIDMICWVGLVGLPFVFFYLKDLYMMSYAINKRGLPTALAITIYMLCLGFTQSAIFEPTVGAIYYILFGIELIKAIDDEAEERVRLSEAAENGDENA